MIRGSYLLWFVFSLGIAAPLLAQTPAPDTSTPITTIRVEAPTVIVDVVVTDDKGKPVTGLTQKDFQVSEDGKPQDIRYFEPHTGTPTTATTVAASQPSPTLPPNTFTNVPLVTPTDSVNVLLMDALNTPMNDQMYVHKEMVKYLDTIPPGTRLGVFLLSNRLQIVQGFSSDSAVLRAAIARSASNPVQSGLLPSASQAAVDQTGAGQIASTGPTGQGATPPSAVQTAAASALQDFQSQQTEFQKNERIEATLLAFQQMARYLSGIPGRKNLIWFSGSFPLCLFSGDCPYQEEVKKTVALLTQARVSIYPISSSTLSPDPLFDASAPPNHNLDSNLAVGSSASQQVTQAQTTSLQTGARDRNTNQDTMAQLARDTGGEAIYNANNLKDALARDINNGSIYYALAYNPTNRSEQGNFRKIDVQLTSGKYKLAFRRGYFEKTAKEVRAASTAPPKDPLRPMMDRGMPDFTELRYRMHVAKASIDSTAHIALAGDNTALQGPRDRLRVTFMLSPEGLALDQTPDGIRHGKIEVAIVVYSHDGKSLNWIVRSFGLAVRPDQYAIAQQAGIPFQLDVDAPIGEAYLRTGVYDISSGKAGTLEIPLNTVTSTVAAK